MNKCVFLLHQIKRKITHFNKKTMESIVLKQDIIEDIKKDAFLFGKIAQALNVVPSSLINILRVNSSKLTQIIVLKILCEHLNIENQEDLLETISGDNNNTQEPQLQETH
jgi:hypothetical protein